MTASEPETAKVEPESAPPREGLAALVGGYFERLRGGEVGVLPVLFGLVLITLYFWSKNSNYVTAVNFNNIVVQMAGVSIIAMGVVFVLLLGEIDLSVGFVSGVAGVVTALLTLPDNSNVFAAGPTMVVVLLVGLAIGTLHGLIITKVGIPSFVVTLAGLLGWNGVVLLLIGDRGTVIIQNSFFVGFANDFLPSATAWIVAVVGIALYAALLFWQRIQRTRHGLPSAPDALLLLRVAVLAIAVLVVVYVCNQDRGVPYVMLMLAGLFILWTYVLNRTRFGRHVYAVGGNAEASRRAGISVDNIKIACFAICSMMAALGGIVLASRLRSVDTGAGGGSILLYAIAAPVIGGTSLFGGRGNIKSAVLGALVIASIDNGLGLLGLSSGTKFVITAGVLLLAVTVDSIARTGRASAGRA